MKSAIFAAGRILRRLISLLAVLLVLCIVAGSLSGYLAVSGQSLPILRAITTQMGHLMASQRTERVAIVVRLAPAEGRLTGAATLTVRSLQNGRRRFYFLLNNGLRLRTVHLVGGAQGETISAYRLWRLTVVDLAQPIPKNGVVRLTFDYDGTPVTDFWERHASVIQRDRVLLAPDSLWYPTDLQSFFRAEVSVTLPSGLTVVANSPVDQAARGGLQEVHWSIDRPVPSLALIAGRYRLTTLDSGGISYRLFLPDDVQLDAQRVLKEMSTVYTTLGARYGATGFAAVTALVSRHIRYGFNDGSGTIGLSIRQYRAGDYGFAALAREISHDWWGDTVTERWLSPGTGGEWIVDGFAEFSGLLATEITYGTDALTSRLASELFDPTRQAALANMSVLDKLLGGATAQNTIYRKGAYVAMMLRRRLGDEDYFSALREFLRRFQFRAVTDRDLQQVLQETTHEKLDSFFAQWVRSDHLADLALNGTGDAAITVDNLGTAKVTGPIDLWTFTKGNPEPARSRVHVGDRVPLPPNSAYLVLDPQLAWLDVQRENNRYPRRAAPVYVAVSSHGLRSVVTGEIHPWVRATIKSVDRKGQAGHTWEFNRGFCGPPTWSPDGTQLLTSYDDPAHNLPSIVILAADGPRHTLGFGRSPGASPGGNIYAARGDRIVRFASDGRMTVVVRRCGTVLGTPRPSPDGKRVAYTGARGNTVELRVVGRDGTPDRLLTTWDRDRLVYRWSPDGSRLYAGIGGNWDWQIWAIPLASAPVRVLVHDAAALTDLAVSPDGTRLAFTAAPALDYPRNRRQLYVLNLKDQTVQNVDVPNADLSSLAWIDSGSLLAVAADVTPGQPWFFPIPHTVKQIRLSDDTVETLP